MPLHTKIAIIATHVFYGVGCLFSGDSAHTHSRYPEKAATLQDRELDIPPCHRAEKTLAVIYFLRYEQLGHPRYSPDLASMDLCVFID